MKRYFVFDSYTGGGLEDFDMGKEIDYVKTRIESFTEEVGRLATFFPHIRSKYSQILHRLFVEMVENNQNLLNEYSVKNISWELEQIISTYDSVQQQFYTFINEQEQIYQQNRFDELELDAISLALLFVIYQFYIAQTKVLISLLNEINNSYPTFLFNIEEIKKYLLSSKFKSLNDRTVYLNSIVDYFEKHVRLYNESKSHIIDSIKEIMKSNKFHMFDNQILNLFVDEMWKLVGKLYEEQIDQKIINFNQNFHELIFGKTIRINTDVSVDKNYEQSENDGKQKVNTNLYSPAKLWTSGKIGNDRVEKINWLGKHQYILAVYLVKIVELYPKEYIECCNKGGSAIITYFESLKIFNLKPKNWESLRTNSKTKLGIVQTFKKETEILHKKIQSLIKNKQN